jgi:hypothetical protein
MNRRGALRRSFAYGWSAGGELDLLALRLGLAERVAAVAHGGGAALDRLPLDLLLRGADDDCLSWRR